MTMYAVLKRDGHAAISLERIPVPQPGPDEVLVRVRATAICGTDLHIAHWDGMAQGMGIRLPLVLGHEFSGEIVETGPNVRGLARGDYIAGETHIPCRECYQCLNGLQHICGRLNMFGIHRDGSFAEFTTIPAVCARKIPPAIPPRIGAILEPLGTSLRAVLDLGVAGDVVAVTGCGPIGLFAIAAAKAVGAFRIVATDIRLDRLELARQLGADAALDPTKTDIPSYVLELTHGVGADAFIDASGNERAIQVGFKSLRKGGKVALIGLPATPVSLNLGVDIVFKEAKVVGIHGRLLFSTWTQLENMLTGGKLAVDSVITHEMSLADWAAGMALLEEGTGGKVILIP